MRKHTRYTNSTQSWGCHAMMKTTCVNEFWIMYIIKSKHKPLTYENMQRFFALFSAVLESNFAHLGVSFSADP